MKCDFCNRGFPESELITETEALHDSGDVEKHRVCEMCAARVEENTVRRGEK